MTQLLEFEIAFPDEQPLQPEEYLLGGDKDVILNIAAFLLGFKPNHSEYQDNKKFLETFFCTGNQQFANEVYEKIKRIEQKGKTVSITNNYISLKLFEIFISQPTHTVTQSVPEFERNFFKAYLVLNSKFLQDQKIAFTSTEEVDVELKPAVQMLCMQYPFADKVNFDIGQIWATQVIKAIYFFEYLEGSQKLQHLLPLLLTHFKSQTWVDYLKTIISLTIGAVILEKESHIDIEIERGDNFEKICEFADNLILNTQDDIDEDDFLSTRSKPFYKVGEGVYRVIFNLFVVEKIFKGLYFFLRDINSALPGQQRIPNLKGIYCHEFSEQSLLYRVMNIVLGNNYKKLTGKELDNGGIKGAPDYYARKAKRAIILESKDFLIRADLKKTFDFNVYAPEFGKTLYYEEQPSGREKPGAVMQLINTIRHLLLKTFKADSDYHYRDLFIYPVIVLHDHQYDIPGLNTLVNAWFQDEVSILESEGLFVKRIKPITVINIDSLIYHQVALSQNITITDVIDAYHDELNAKPQKDISYENYAQFFVDKMIPFSIFIDKFFDKKGLRSLPPVLDIVTPALFKEELERRQL